MITYQATQFYVRMATHSENYSTGDLVIELLNDRGGVYFLAGEINKFFKTPAYTIVKMSKTLNIGEF